MQTKWLGALAAVGFWLGSAGADPVKTGVDKTELERVLAGWPERPVAAVQALIPRYGMPNEVTPTMVVWHKNGEWLRTIVHRGEVHHDFPAPHVDILEQEAALRVPVARVDDVVAFDGSVSVRRTEGVVAIRCDSEEMNFLAVNLAHDVAIGRKSTASARQELARAAAAFERGRKHRYMERLRFLPRTGDPADRDVPAAAAERYAMAATN